MKYTSFSSDAPAPAHRRTTRNIHPYLIALGILLVLVGSIVVITLVNPRILTNTLTGIEKVIQPQTQYTSGQTVVVKSVSDGDTFTLENGEKVRLLNIDTPETVKDNTPVMCYGPEASQYLRTLLPAGTNIIIQFDKEKHDQYGRLLVFAFFSNSDTSHIENSINALIVQQGYGRSVVYKPNNTYERYFRGLERTAKEQNKGVWKCPFPFTQ